MERTSRYALLVHLRDDKSSDSVTTGVIKALSGLPEHMRLSLTWDRGLETAEHARISTALYVPVFFCDPASSWPRAPTRTPTDCFANTSRKAPISQGIARKTYVASKKPSTTDPENPSVGEPQPRFSLGYLPPSTPCVATTARHRAPETDHY